MALSTAKFSELPFHNPIPICSRPSLSFLRCRFRLLISATSSSSSSFRLGVRNYGDSVPRQNPNPNLRSRKYPWDEDYPLRDDQKGSSPVNPRGQGPQRLRPSPSAPWLQRWTPPSSQIVEPPPEKRKNKKEMEQEQGDAGYLDSSESRTGPIERIVHRLRNLGLGDGEEKGVLDRMEVELDEDVRLGDLLERSWNRPDGLVKNDQAVLPWERGGDNESKGEEEGDGLKRRRMKAPTLAELTIEDLELRRLRRDGMILRERITIPKAGVTQAIVEKIHDVWRKSELARLKFHETLAHDMKTAHELVERRTGGLVTWRSGSVMLVYRGSNYQRPSRSQSLDGKDIPTKVLHDDKQVLHEGDALFVPDVSCPVTLPSVSESNAVPLIPEQIEQSSFMTGHADCMTAEEAEFNQLLDGLGPRFVDWWGTGILPVDADLLPQNIPGYKTPFRLLPTGMRSRLTNAEMTNLRKLARSLPCHFALGRNRNHHGLAAAIVRLWETSLVVKIAVKRGIQNTNNKLMAEELKMLTGGLLLQRNKYYIVIYRGKDFLPTSVATALAERQELTKDIQDVEEQARNSLARQSHAEDVEGHALAGTLAEFHEAKARWGREVSAEERERMKEEASRYKTARVVKRIEHKLSIAQAKKLRAERLLAKIESSMIPVGPSNDQETITDEERSVFRRIGLRMKAYLPLGIRGVFDGVIENMHLHWKHRELVKLISKQKTLSFVEDTARLLEYESDGILVAIERVPKGYALIYYRGKNYQRPISLRPRNLLTKAKALKRSVSMQRHEALCQHISELERAIEQINLELGDSVDVEGRNRSENVQVDHAPQFTKLEDQDSSFESEDDDSDDFDINDYGD